MSLTAHDVTNLEEPVLLFRILQQQFNLIHKVGLWKLNICKRRLEKKKTKNHKLQFRKKKKKNNRRETMTRLLAYRALVFLLKDLTCAAQVDTRALILFRCISMVSLSVICSVRHNSRTTWNKILLIKKNINKVQLQQGLSWLRNRPD